MSEETIHFCPLCGTNTVKQTVFGHERATCPNCGWIHFADPKVAAAMVVESDGMVLLTRRINEPQRGLWSLPAGYVDAGEDPAKAAVRECLEETGLMTEVTGLIDVVSGREHKKGADIVIIYRGRVIGGKLQAGDDADLAEFFPRNQLPPLAFKATRRALGLEE